MRKRDAHVVSQRYNQHKWRCRIIACCIIDSSAEHFMTRERRMHSLSDLRSAAPTHNTIHMQRPIMRPKLWSGGDENALCCNSNLRNSSKNNLASAISRRTMLFHPLRRRARTLSPGRRAFLAPAAAARILHARGLCVCSPCTPCHTGLGKVFFLFWKNNLIKLFRVESTHTSPNIQHTRDEVVLII